MKVYLKVTAYVCYAESYNNVQPFCIKWLYSGKSVVKWCYTTWLDRFFQ